MGSGMTLFGSYVGLRNFEELPAKLLNKYMAAIYIVLGGFLALIFQLVAPTSFTPLYSLTVGVGWPALLIGLSTSQNAQNIANAKLKEIEDLIKGIQGG
jgi:hypothetical protein